MKQIYDTQALQVLPCQNGFIFVIKQEEVEDKAVITYKLLDLERMTMAASTRNVYLLTKFGNHFQKFDENPESFLGVNTLFFPDHRLLVCQPDGACSVYSSDGVLRYQGSLAYKDQGPDSITLGDNCLWASYPQEGAVIRYGLQNLRPELRIGGGSSRLPTPTGLMYLHDRLLFCSPSEKKIFQLNPVEYDLEEYHTFSQPVYRFYKYNSHELVVLDTGVYKL